MKPALELLNFNTNNKHNEKVIESLRIIKDHLKDKTQFLSKELSILINTVIKQNYKDLIVNDDGRVNRVKYELALLHSLKDKFKIKEVWITNSYKYRNLEENSSQDFKEKRKHYYNFVNKSLDAKKFILKTKKELFKNLSEFNSILSKNKFFKILKKLKGHIKVAKLTEQDQPQ